MRVGNQNRWKKAILGVAIFLASSARAEALESRSFAVSLFAHAAFSQDGDCKGGLNPKMDVQYGRDLRALGYNGEKLEKLSAQLSKAEVQEGGWETDEVMQILVNRARVNGQPASAYANPAAVIDPKLNYVTGSLAYGFNLDGKGAGEADTFEDPETHEKGVDHGLFRVLGCLEPYRGNLEHDGTYWTFMWTSMKDTAPAWLITVSGESLSKDGPVTISFARGMEPVRYNGDGEAKTDLTFRKDPDPRFAKNVFKGEIRDGVVIVTEPGDFYLLQDPLMFRAISLSSFHFRMKIDDKGYMSGIIGGYQPIDDIYFALGNAGVTYEQTFSPELPGIYHLLRRFADGKPDPKTGQRWSISAAYHFKAARAFVVEPSATASR